MSFTMTNPIRLVLALHNHQPVGNFDHVCEQAYQDSYLPFLDVFSRYPSLRIGLHTSGPLMEWLSANHDDYLDRIADLVSQGRIEIIGGAYYEPILAMLPTRDRIGQIYSYTQWLKNRFGGDIRGMWVPERVWEQSMTRDLVDAEIEYTILDDFHFKAAGLTEDQLHGHLITEDEGRTLRIFPDSERLRYLIPFGEPHATIDYLREIADHHPNAVAVFGDDGEKFGTWPDTKRHVYEDGWLYRFFDALVENHEWINVCTPSEALDATQPVGKIYLPDCSYREMTEWSLPAEQLSQYEETSHKMPADDHNWKTLKRFVRGGFWRNFKVKYPESDEMYSRMMMVSRRLQAARDAGITGETIDKAQTALYRGQCNCAYWHGAFGGIYLPHLRNAVFSQLIEADRLLNKVLKRPESWVEATADDLNFDGRPEIRLANERLSAILTPAEGGHLVELDLERIRHNLLATLTRRPEAYHRKILHGANNPQDECASIHDRIKSKQPDLDKHIKYDAHRRKSLIDLFYPLDTQLDAIVGGHAHNIGDFVDRPYETVHREKEGRVQIQMTRQGNVEDMTFVLSKAISLNADSDTLEIAYMFEGLPQDRTLLFAPEMNFAGMPADLDDRYFTGDDQNLGHLGGQLNQSDLHRLTLTDEWLGIDVGLDFSRPTNIWTYPIRSVNQSEDGFELVHQSVCVLPHWYVQGDDEGRWMVTMHLKLDTSRAEHRHNESMAASVS